MDNSIIILILSLFLFSCKEIKSTNEKDIVIENLKTISINLTNGLELEMKVPNRYDSLTKWKDSDVCFDGLCNLRLRYQPSSLITYNERSIEYIGDNKFDSLNIFLFKDSIDRLTILVPYILLRNHTYSELQVKNEIFELHNKRLKNLKNRPDNIHLTDSILLINHNYYSLFISEWSDSISKSIYKEIIASTIIHGNNFTILSQLVTKENNQNCLGFIENSKNVIRSIKINYGI